MNRFPYALALALAALVLPSAPVRADGPRQYRDPPPRRAPEHRVRRHSREEWRRGHWFHGDHGGHVGWWWVVGIDWYFYPRPVYPYPREIVVLPPAQAPYCRQFNGDATIDASGQPFYGTACLQGDGRWHIVP